MTCPELNAGPKKAFSVPRILEIKCISSSRTYRMRRVYSLIVRYFRHKHWHANTRKIARDTTQNASCIQVVRILGENNEQTNDL